MPCGCPTAEIILTDAPEVVKKKLKKWKVGRRVGHTDIWGRQEKPVGEGLDRGKTGV